MDLILASTSPYRKALLARLQHPFRCLPPDTDETPLAGETGAQLALRLALAKARSVARAHPAALVIGSDQVAELDGRLIGTAISFTGLAWRSERSQSEAPNQKATLDISR